MVPFEKKQEMDAVVNFWKSRIEGLNAELGMLQDLRTHGRCATDRYAADRLLREIKRKSAEIIDTRQCLRRAQRDLGVAVETTGERGSTLSHLRAPSFDQGQASH